VTVPVDARGLLCPWPAIRAARAWRERGGPVAILTDDPAAPAGLAALAAELGATLVQLSADPPVFQLK